MAMTAALVFFGRAAGMSIGYAMEVDHSVIILFSIFIEIALVLLLYPLFVLAWRRLVVIKPLKRFMERTRETAEAHHDAIIKYGIPGLLFFVWFPFWMTGPLVGCVIGFFLGLRHWVNLTVVLVGTTLAILSWALLLRKIHEHVSGFSPYAPVVLMVILIVILAVVLLVRGLRRKKRSSSVSPGANLKGGGEDGGPGHHTDGTQPIGDSMTATSSKVGTARLMKP
jgi:uncharacterized membrane protein